MTLSVCVSDEPFLPFTDPHHDGESQKRIRLATERQGWQMAFVALPWRRCLAGVERGIYDAIAGLAATPEYQRFMAYPQQAGRLDQTWALGVTRLVVYRSVGGAAGWDGQHFSELDRPVLHLSGRATLRVLLEHVGVEAEDSARTSSQLAQMLLKGRGSLAIDHDYEVTRLATLPEFQGRLEVLPTPLGEASIYLAVGWHLYERHHQVIESIWDEFGALQRAAGSSSRPY
ncbi:hypothetical protein [Pseudomonas benzenivorans]|uniref:hypothetical protein n=1 Tax=Pseudomonas benzenivorans TaxID=556533 RepID=UPI003517D371